MSEYQYYEFLAIDRPLTDSQMRELRDVSSRARITPTSFVNVYNWGNFKGNPRRLMEHCFDAFLYVANWGTRRLMLRLPKSAVEQSTIESYCVGDSFSTWATGEHVILDFAADVEPEGWEEGEGLLSSLVPLRSLAAHLN